MNNKVILCLLVAIFIFVGCKNETNMMSIPFYTKSNKNNKSLVKIKVAVDMKIKPKKELIFVVDTGADESLVCKSGIEKIFGTTENYWKSIEEFGISKNEMEELGAWALVENIDIRIGHKTFTDSKICFAPNIEWVCDGVLSYKFFLENYERITFDFKSKKLVLNGEPIEKEIVPLIYGKNLKDYSDQTLGEYPFIPIEINGKTYYAGLDTGLSTTYEKQICAPNDIVLDEKIEVDIGSEKFENVVVERYKNFYFPFESLTTTVCRKKISLPNAFFQNHRIQLDFENMTFAMD